MDGSCVASAHRELDGLGVPSGPTAIRILGKRLDVPLVRQCAVAGAIVLALSSEPSGCLAQTLIRKMTGPPNAAVSDSYGPCGDLSGDGIADVVAGVMHPVSRVFVFSGSDGSVVQAIDAPLPLVGFGHSVAGGTDVSGDGVPDILVGAFLGPQQEGRVYVYSGASYSLIRVHVGVAGQNLGEPVAFLDDLDGDLIPEYAAGATHDSGIFRPPEVGQAYVYSGATGAILFPLIGEQAGDLFGDSIASVGFVDGDAVPDFALGAPGYGEPGASLCGAVYIYSGLTGQLIRKDRGPDQLNLVGHSVVGLGDLDGDSSGDYATSWYPLTNGALVVSGGTGKILTQMQASTSIPLAPGIGAIEDMDGDGGRDVLLANWEINGPGGGHVAVVGSLSGAEVFRIDDPLPLSQAFPVFAVGLDDIDGDGREDIGTLDLYDDPAGGGSIYVFSTRPLYGLATELPASTGGAVPFDLNAGVAHANAPYLLLASVTPSGPTTCGAAGTPVGPMPVYVPMCSDIVMQFSILMANTKPFVNTRGTLDAVTGKGFATFDLTGISLPPAVVGFSFYFAYIAKGPAGGPWDLASNAESVLIVP